jgi:cytochrome c556
VRPIVLAFAALATAGSAYAAVKPETAIHYRQAVYRVILWNFLPLGEMYKGRTPFDAKEAERRAERIAAASEQLLEGFPAGSDSGAETAAKAEIWSERADFEAKMKDFTTQSRALVAAAHSGDEAKFRAQFDDLKSACKSCHDTFRSE